MEDNVYSVIQEWHELLENGTISEEEFLDKKNELLNFSKESTISNVKKSKRTSQVLLPAILFVFFAGAFSVYYFYLFPIDNEVTNSRPNYEYEDLDEPNTAYGFFTVERSQSNRAYFHDEPKPDTKRKAYLTTEDNFVLVRIENGYAFVEFENGNGQITDGWLNMDDITECLDCE